MSLKQQLDDDLKAAMLARDNLRVDTIKGLKSAILYAEVEQKKRDSGLSDPEVLVILTREAKKRQESITLYRQGGAADQADKEAAEKAIIDAYLPRQLSDEDLAKAIDQAIASIGLSQQNLGQLIGEVKKLTAGAADGSRIAEAVKKRLETA